MADWHLWGGAGTRYRKQSLFPVNGVKAFVQMCATAQLGSARSGGDEKRAGARNQDPVGDQCVKVWRSRCDPTPPPLDLIEARRTAAARVSNTNQNPRGSQTRTH